MNAGGNLTLFGPRDRGFVAFGRVRKGRGSLLSSRVLSVGRVGSNAL